MDINIYKGLYRCSAFLKQLAIFLTISYWYICSIIGISKFISELSGYMTDKHLTYEGLLNQLIGPMWVVIAIVLGLCIILIAVFSGKDFILIKSIKLFGCVVGIGGLTFGLFSFISYLNEFYKFIFLLSLCVTIIITTFLYCLSNLPEDRFIKIIDNIKIKVKG